MPLDNSLNVSELLRRLGVKGDSLGSAPLLESMRMSLQVGDMSQLVPPLLGPIGGGSLFQGGGAGVRNKWSILCRAPGGLTILSLRIISSDVIRIFVTDTVVLGVGGLTVQENFSFGQNVASIFQTHASAAATIAPVNSPEFGQGQQPAYGVRFPNWIGPGQSFNMEGEGVNVSGEITMFWLEYPAALNPGTENL